MMTDGPAPFRFSIRGLLVLTSALAAAIALVMRSPAAAMWLALVAVWGAILFWPDVLHTLARRRAGWMITISLLGGILFAVGALTPRTTNTAVANTTEVLAWCSGGCFFLAGWTWWKRRG